MNRVGEDRGGSDTSDTSAPNAPSAPEKCEAEERKLRAPRIVALVSCEVAEKEERQTKEIAYPRRSTNGKSNGNIVLPKIERTINTVATKKGELQAKKIHEKIVSGYANSTHSVIVAHHATDEFSKLRAQTFLEQFPLRFFNGNIELEEITRAVPEFNALSNLPLTKAQRQNIKRKVRKMIKGVRGINMICAPKQVLAFICQVIPEICLDNRIDTTGISGKIHAPGVGAAVIYRFFDEGYACGKNFNAQISKEALERERAYKEEREKKTREVIPEADPSQPDCAESIGRP